MPAYSWCMATLLAAGIGAAGAEAPSDATTNLLPNADFSADSDGDQWPDHWGRAEGATWEAEAGHRFLRLRSLTPGQMVLVYRPLPLPSPAPQALEIRLRMRHADIEPGEKPWFDGRVIFHFKDAAGKVLQPDPDPVSVRGTSLEWVERKPLLKVPKGARLLEIMPSLFQAARGTLDLAQCLVSPASLPPPVPSATLVPAHPEALPPELQVVGNRLQTAANRTVWLQGLAVPSLEWSLAGEHLQQSVEIGIKQWKANVIRLPVQDGFWFGQHKQQKDGGADYRAVVDAVVEAVAERGAYLALDLHAFGAPTEEHVAFWKDAATRYRNHPAVLFDLFNEPHGIAWKVWRAGGKLGDSGGHKDANPAENATAAADAGAASVGMQALVDTVRATGARNIVIAGGLDWGYDLSGVTEGFALEERPGGRGIVYSSHIYPWKHDWPAKVLAAAAKYPLFIGEVGCPLEPMSFIPREQHQDPFTWAPDVLAVIQQHKLNWTAWSFHPTAAPNAIADWNYTPTPYWGAFVKDALAGKTFELKRMR